MTMRIGVVVVSYNSAPHLRRCLEALAAQRRRPDRIVVVDNASTDGSPELLRAMPGIELVEAGSNLGFAAANNLAVRRLPDCAWVALLNPDAFAEPDWLERLAGAAAAELPEVASLASLMVLDAAPDRIDSAGDGYTVYGAAWPRGHYCATAAFAAPRDTFSACGGAALYRREAWERVGGFDESLFCYLEDVDLGFRLRLAGHRCRFVPQARVRHVGGASSGRRSAFTVFHSSRNLAWVYVKNMPGPLLLVFALPHLLLHLLGTLKYTVMGRGGASLRGRLASLRGLPAVWAQRRALQRERRVGSVELLRALSWVGDVRLDRLVAWWRGRAS